MTSKDLIIPIRLSRKIIYFIYIVYLPHSLFEKFINDSLKGQFTKKINNNNKVKICQNFTHPYM